MGFYHGTAVVYGAMINTPEPYKTKWNVLETPLAEGILKKYALQATMVGVADREYLFLTANDYDLGVGEIFNLNDVTPSVVQVWSDKIKQCAYELGMELVAEPGWVVAHEYK